MTTTTPPTEADARRMPPADGCPLMTRCTHRLPLRRAQVVRDAVAAGADAVAALGMAEMTKRMSTATAEGDKRHWSTYRLWHPTPARREDLHSVINPDGVLYEAELTDEGVVRYPDCPDQAFCDLLNLALDAFSIPLRVETKHCWIARRLVEARAQEVSA